MISNRVTTDMNAMTIQGSAVYTLAIRELTRFFRQRSRLIGALGQPIVFWILFGTGLRGSFDVPSWAPETLTYQQYFFPGVIALILLFTAIFATISIIEDRKEGFLQGVLVSPVSRTSIVLGKVLGGTMLAMIQVALFVAVVPLLWLVGMAPQVLPAMDPLTVIGLIAFIFVFGLALTSLGFLLAWPMDSTQGFHAVMSIVLMPMWLLSGAFFPTEGAGWLKWVMLANPMTYGVAGLQRLMLPGLRSGSAPGLPSMPLCVTATIVFATICLAISVQLANRQAIRNSRAA
jgi:ABC-2 type transport system permease protein